MKSSRCPKCGSATVYAKDSGVTYGKGGYGAEVDTGGWTAQASLVVSYLCTTCGYFENYIKDPNKLAEVARNKDWQAVPNTAR